MRTPSRRDRLDRFGARKGFMRFAFGHQRGREQLKDGEHQDRDEDPQQSAGNHVLDVEQQILRNIVMSDRIQQRSGIDADAVQLIELRSRQHVEQHPQQPGADRRQIVR